MELPLHFVGTEISPSPAHSLFQVTADLPIWGHGDISLPSSEFTSTSLSPNEGQTVGRTLEGTSLVGLALLITKTNTSCCPEHTGKTMVHVGWKRMKKEQQRNPAAKPLPCADCFPGVKYSSCVREAEGVARSP